MFKGAYHVPLKPGQLLRFIFFPDTHFDTPECDRDRLIRFVEWCVGRKKRGELVRLAGLGDALDFASPSERRLIASGLLHETTAIKFDRAHLEDLREFVAALKPIHADFIGLLTGHHEYLFATKAAAGKWKGRSSDEWLADQFGCDYWGNGVALFRLLFPHDLHLDLLGYHGSGGAQTAGGRVQKRIRVAEIAPAAHIVATAHDNCLPLRARALTRDGWKGSDDLVLGEDILAYDVARDACVWRPVLGITRPGLLPMRMIESKTFSMSASPDHRWVRVNQHKRHRCLVPTDGLLTSHKIVVAALAESGSATLTPQEAALLGWIVTDGHIRRSRKRPQAILTQSKPVGIQAIRGLVGKPGGSICVSERLDGPRTSSWARSISIVFTLRAAWTERLLDRVGYEIPTHLCRVVTRLSSQARTAMLHAMLLGDGSFNGYSWSFAQKPGPVLDAFCILALLEGHRLSRSFPDRNGVVKIYLLKQRHANVNRMKICAIEPEAGWCPTTTEGTWVTELDGQITITGNCKMAYPRSGLDYEQGSIKRYVVGAGSFQRAYLEGSEAGFAERMGLVPADLGVTIIDIKIEQRHGRWRVDYHCSV